MERNEGRKSSRIALSGLLLAFTVIILYIESVAPSGRLSLYALSSFMVSIIIINYSAKAGWVFFFASSLLSFLLIPDKLGVVPYIAFFGVYGILKYYIEKLNKRLPELILKLLFYNAVLVLGLLFMKEFLFHSLNTDMSIWIIAGISEIVFLIYDYVYSMFIGFYTARLSKYFRG